MLTHRTNVLLSEEDNRWLTNLANEKKVTKSELIRRAIRKTYTHARSSIEKTGNNQKRKELMKRIKENHKFLKDPHIAINWKEYRDEGRKY